MTALGLSVNCDILGSLNCFFSWLRCPCWTCEYADVKLETPDTCFDCVNFPKEWDIEKNPDIVCQYWHQLQYSDDEWDCPEDCRQTVFYCTKEKLDDRNTNDEHCIWPCPRYLPREDLLKPTQKAESFKSHCLEEYI